MSELRLPIGRVSPVHPRVRARHRLGAWRPSVCRPLQPFARLRYQSEGGEAWEISFWLPGPHPDLAAWWEDLGLWMLVCAA